MTSAATVNDTELIESGDHATWLRDERTWCVLMLVAQLPVLLVHLSHLWDRPAYRFFPIILLTIAFVFLTRTQRLSDAEVRPLSLLPSSLLWGISLLLLLLGSVVVFSPWLCAVAVVMCFAGVMLFLRRRYYVRNLPGILLLSCLLIPIPAMLTWQLSPAIDGLAARISGGLLSGLGVVNLAEGSTLSLVDRILLVDELSGSFVSMALLVALALIIAIAGDRSAIQVVLLVAAAVVWGFVANVARVVAAALFWEKQQIDVTAGVSQFTLETCLLIVATLLVLSTDRLLAWALASFDDPRVARRVQVSAATEWWQGLTTFGRPRLEPDAYNSEADEYAPRRRGWSPQSFVIVWGVLFCVIGLVSLAAVLRDATRASVEPPRFWTSLVADSLPEKVGRWQRVGHAERFAEEPFQQSAKAWRYANADLNGEFAISFGFQDWQDLRQTYRSGGWIQWSADLAGGRSMRNTTSASFQKAEQHGLLLFCFFDKNRNLYPPPQRLTSMIDHLRRRFHRSDQSLYQIQLWVTSEHPLRAADWQEAQAAFERLRAKLRSEIRSSDNRRDDGQ